MPVFVNRTLNLKRIKLIGFDMDYTLVPYKTEAFEGLTHKMALRSLVRDLGYPRELLNLVFDFQRAIVGLVIDKRNGYLLQINRYGKVKSSRFGLEEVPFTEQNQIYQNRVIDLRDDNFVSLDTSFAISQGVLFSQLVELKKQGLAIPPYYKLLNDIILVLDTIHQDGSLKSSIKKNYGKYVVRDPRVALMLERFKDAGKKLMLITNSDYAYTKSLLDFALNPHFLKHKSWLEVFDLVITLADKPKFFGSGSRFLAIDRETGLMKNHSGPVDRGIFQGGDSSRVQADFRLQGNEILYIGDHIFGDVLAIKKQCDWRTALVLGDLEMEILGLKRSRQVQTKIDQLMLEKENLEKKINAIDLSHYEGKPVNKQELAGLFRKIDGLNLEISENIALYKSYFNPYWGEILRAGSEESRYAEQVEKYACIYMTRVSELYEYSPKTYFRPRKRFLPHEELK